MNIKHLLLIGAVLGTVALPSFAAKATLKGVFALPGMPEMVNAELEVMETGPLSRALLIAFTDKATGQPITGFDEELTQELHVLATDSDFSSFVHEHAGILEADRRFRVEMHFPKPGLYHVYADAVPTGYGQQVIRFEIPVDITTGSPESLQLPVGPAIESGSPYTANLDGSTLQAGTENMMELTIQKHGKPAMDLGLFLGVPAHAVFISTDDLSYVHAHAMETDSPEVSHTEHVHHDDPQGAIPAKLMLHVTPNRAGRYALWIQFKGGDEVQTVPFVVNVSAAP